MFEVSLNLFSLILEIPALMLSIIVATLSGSVLSFGTIVFIILHNRYQRSYDIAFLNVALADFLFATSGCIDALYFRKQDRAYCYGDGIINSFCLCIGVFRRIFAPYAQILDFLAILPVTTDRMIAVLKPLQYGRYRLYRGIIILTWVIRIPFIILQFFLGFKAFSETYDGNIMHLKPFYLVQSVVFCMVPLIITSICFIYIFINLSKRRVTIRVATITATITVICFSLSWIPVTVAVHFFRVKQWHWFLPLLYTNAITDPFVYVMPVCWIFC